MMVSHPTCVGNVCPTVANTSPPAEIKSLCLTMVSAGLDTVSGNLVMALAYLSSEGGQRIQQKAYEEIMKVYPESDAWDKYLVEEKVPYITALVKEVLRYWTVIPICLPCRSIRDNIKWGSAVIPAGTTFFMVSLVHLPTKKSNVKADPCHCWLLECLGC